MRATSHTVHLSLAIAAALLAGCEKQPQTCIGPVAVQFLMQGTLDETGTTCDFASADVPARTISVATNLALDAARSSATLCLDRPEAAPLKGTLAGGSADFQVGSQRSALAACGPSCTIQIDEKVHLDLTQDPTTSKPTAVGGTVTDTVSEPLPSDGCHPTTATSKQCLRPCTDPQCSSSCVIVYSISRVELQ